MFNPASSYIAIPKGHVLAVFQPANSDCLISRLDDHQVNNMQINIQILINDSSYTGDGTNDDKDGAFMSNFTIPTHISEREQMRLTDCLKAHIDLFVTNVLANLRYNDRVQLKIVLKSDYKPKNKLSDRLTPDKKVLRHHLDNLLGQSIIAPVVEPDDIPITSSVVLV